MEFDHIETALNKRNQSKVVRSLSLSSRATTTPEQQPHNYMIIANAIFYNGTQPDKVYLGENLVWEKETTPKAGNFAGRYSSSSNESDWWYINKEGKTVSIADYVDPETKEFSVFVDDWKKLNKTGSRSNYSYAEITAVPINENTTTANQMFAWIRNVDTIDLSPYNKDNITDVSSMFWYSDFTNIHFGKWDMAKCETVGNWFLYAYKVTNVTGNFSNIGLNSRTNITPNYPDLSNCPLTAASAMVFINGLVPLTEGQYNSNIHRIAFKATTYDQLTPEQIAVATNKGWNVVRYA